MNIETIQNMGVMVAIVATLVAAAYAFAYASFTWPPIGTQFDLAVFQSCLEPALIQVRSDLIRPNPT